MPKPQLRAPVRARIRAKSHHNRLIPAIARGPRISTRINEILCIVPVAVLNLSD